MNRNEPSLCVYCKTAFKPKMGRQDGSSSARHCLTNFLVIKAFLGEVVNKFVKLLSIKKSYKIMGLYVQPILGKIVHYFRRPLSTEQKDPQSLDLIHLCQAGAPG